jgi:hypothetical protein
MSYRVVFVNEEGVVTGTLNLPEGTDATKATELALGLLEGDHRNLGKGHTSFRPAEPAALRLLKLI